MLPTAVPSVPMTLKTGVDSPTSTVVPRLRNPVVTPLKISTTQTRETLDAFVSRSLEFDAAIATSTNAAATIAAPRVTAAEEFTRISF